MNSRVLIFFSTFTAIVVSTTLIFLWAKGYTFDRQTQTVGRVGMISAKSLPDGARIFLDEKLASATNTTLGNLKGGLHKLRLEKEGFSSWEKTVLVKEELVTFVEAVLVPKSVEIKPLTSAGVLLPTYNNNRDKIYFLSKSPSEAPTQGKSGLWTIDLNSSIFNIFRNGASLVFPDQSNLIFSSAEALRGSPVDSQLLIQMNGKGYYLADLSSGEQPIATSTAQPTLETWTKKEALKRQSILEKYKLPPDLSKIAVDPETNWSPDEKKFLYRRKNESGDSWRYYVRNLTELLGVGEKDEYLIATVALAGKTKFSWYPDSRHIISSECEDRETKEVEKKLGSCLAGSIHLLEIDGTNNTQVYSGSMASDQVFPTPDGSKIVILATFNQTAPPNLYAITLR